jgi:hypothetical protein
VIAGADRALAVLVDAGLVLFWALPLVTLVGYAATLQVHRMVLLRSATR